MIYSWHIEDCEHWLAQGSETEDGHIVDNFVRQLADTMRENERLRKELSEYQQDAQKLVNLVTGNKHSVPLCQIEGCHNNSVSTAEDKGYFCSQHLYPHQTKTPE